MKKIIIIFIIVFCLLCLLEISCLSQEHINWAEYWNPLTDYGKQVYLLGLGNGLTKGVLDGVNQFVFAPNFPKGKEGEKINKVYIKPFLDEYFQYINFISGPDSSNCNAVKNVITDLYKDPANVFIPIAEMSFIAYKKLKGENVESLLQEAREEALQ